MTNQTVAKELHRYEESRRQMNRTLDSMGQSIEFMGELIIYKVLFPVHWRKFSPVSFVFEFVSVCVCVAEKSLKY